SVGGLFFLGFVQALDVGLGAAGADQAEYQGQNDESAAHEGDDFIHHGLALGAEGAAALAAAEGRADAAGVALAEQHEHDQRHGVDHEHDGKNRKQGGVSGGQCHFISLAASSIARRLSSSRLAPPTSTPSTSGCDISSSALSGLTLPPYRMGSLSKPSFLNSFRMKACISAACPGVAVSPVPIAQTGS